MAYFVSNIRGTLTLHDNCFLGNDERIAPIVMEDGTLETSSTFVHRQKVHLPPTGCEFAARVAQGKLSRVGIKEVLFSCIPSDSSVCTASSLPRVELPCLTTLDDIYHGEEILNTTDAEQTRTYVLCPQTTYLIASMNDESGKLVSGSLPIIVNHPNLRVLCGADGKQDNRCIIYGGVVQLGIFDEFQTQGPSATNVLVQGLTFSAASSVNVLARFPGDVFFRDCLFTVSSMSVSRAVAGFFPCSLIFDPLFAGQFQPCIHLRGVFG